jgi:hypothetical protein
MEFKNKKIALCFIISYQQILNKESLWKKWIEPNQDIINIYFHYNDYKTIKSHWIKKYCIPYNMCAKTSYFYVVNAYMNLISYSYFNDSNNQWFCFLTESCVPIISPKKFRELFYKNMNKSILFNDFVNWNVHMNKRANLRLLTKEFHLKHDPWFTLTREDVFLCLKYVKNNNDIYKKICNGIIANESIFAIILKAFGVLKNVINSHTHAVDWNRRMNPNSPYLFKTGSKMDIDFIKDFLEKNQYTMFLRKVDPLFPDHILNTFIGI